MTRTYDPETGVTTFVLADGTEASVRGRHDRPMGRTTPRRRKDRHVPRGRTADASPVERVSARATAGTLNLSDADRHDRSRARETERRGFGDVAGALVDAARETGDDPLAALNDLYSRLPRE